MDQARSDWSAQQASAALARSDLTRHRGDIPIKIFDIRRAKAKCGNGLELVRKIGW
jgi:hypothetical protein